LHFIVITALSIMENLSIDKLGQVNYSNYPLAQQLKEDVALEKFDIFAFKSCGGSCGDSNCS